MPSRTRRRQVHLWLSEREYAWVRAHAAANDETLSATLRRLVVGARRLGGAQALGGGTAIERRVCDAEYRPRQCRAPMSSAVRDE